MFGLVIPARGEIAWICPAFELERAKELIRFGMYIRTWEEHQSPYELMAHIFRDRGFRSGRIGLEERIRFFPFDEIQKAALYLEYVSANPVTIGCGIIKSDAEITLMHKAKNITIKAYKAAVAQIERGMTKDDIHDISIEALASLGSSGGTGAQIAFALRMAEPGTRVAEVCRKFGITEQTYYRWKKKYGGLGVSELHRLRELEEENRRLKRMVADLSLDKQMLQDVLSKKL
jgi:Xaa-Pro aminopeptidase